LLDYSGGTRGFAIAVSRTAFRNSYWQTKLLRLPLQKHQLRFPFTEDILGLVKCGSQQVKFGVSPLKKNF
jgi:hypothetical protein